MPVGALIVHSLVMIVFCLSASRLRPQRTERGLVFVPPKTHRSSRPLPLSSLAVRALEQQRVRQAKERLAAGEVWHDQGLVFASTIGTPMEPRNVNRRFEECATRPGW